MNNAAETSISNEKKIKGYDAKNWSNETGSVSCRQRGANIL